MVVVGAGGAGCVLAERLTRSGGLDVLVLEAGAVPERFPDDLLDARTIAGARPDHPANWAFAADLRPGRPWNVARGRIAGGSTTVNGTYFVRARDADFDDWASRGNDAWTAAAALPFHREIENDLDFGSTSLHGGGGPVPVRRAGPDLHPVTRAFTAACRSGGHPVEEDKNSGTGSGIGLLPRNAVDGVRVNAYSAFLAPHLDRTNLTVQGDTVVRRVLVDAGVALGVEFEFQGHVQTVRARDTVLSAGALATPHLLNLSGLGGPGVGLISDHPSVSLAWTCRTGPCADPYEAVLNLPDLELLPQLKPTAALLGTGPDTGPLGVTIALQENSATGELRTVSDDPHVRPRIRFDYLAHPHDRRRLREGVRLAHDLLRSDDMRDVVDDVVDLTDSEVRSDEALDRWIGNHLGTALHTCGTARMGPDDDPLAVADQFGRVRGVRGLRIADTSILPTAPTRGPAQTALVVGARIADFFLEQEG